ncbi:MAG: hypothetical protein JXA52_06810, partial [Planctomycetes bacterium]|nr:hypothetical protein [Planctomycetota bacterium]
ILTTSIAEGFGLAFLEPWLAERMLAGRALPEITAEFQAAGIELANLYGRLDIPLEWLDQEVFANKVRVGLEKNYISYGSHLQPADLDRAMNAAINGDCVDFGCLDEELQQEVIRKVKGSSTARSELQGCAGSNILEIDLEKMRPIIKNNRACIKRNYNLEQYGKKLAEIYREVYNSPVEEVSALSQRELLAHFLAPERFRLLRT